MTVYESMFILRASLSDEAVSSVLDKAKAIIEQHGAVVLTAENWGKKKLAYEMQHDRRGTFVFLRFESAQGRVVSELERLYRLEDSVLKFLTVKADKAPPAVDAEGKGAAAVAAAGTAPVGAPTAAAGTAPVGAPAAAPAGTG